MFVCKLMLSFVVYRTPAAPAFGKIAQFGLSYLKIPPTVSTTK